MKTRFLALAGAALLTLAQTASAVLVGSDGFTGALVKIDETTGAAVQFAAVPQAGLGVAYNPNTDTWYTRNFNSLYTFDLAGNVTLVGSSGTFITGLTFDASYSTLYSVNQGSGDLFAVDPLTGAATLVGNTGVSTPLDLSTNSAGTVYLGSINGDIFTVDTSTGAATLVLSTGSLLTSIAFDASDKLYGVTLNGDVLTFDLLGAPTAVGVVQQGATVFQDIRGLAFDRSADPVPEPLTAALLGLGLVGLGLRRRTA